jgi:hypothetical protein
MPRPRALPLWPYPLRDFVEKKKFASSSFRSMLDLALLLRVLWFRLLLLSVVSHATAPPAMSYRSRSRHRRPERAPSLSLASPLR